MLRRLLRAVTLWLVRRVYVGKQAQHRTVGPYGPVVMSQGRFVSATWEDDSLMLRYVPDGGSPLDNRKVETRFISGDVQAKMWVFHD